MPCDQLPQAPGIPTSIAYWTHYIWWYLRIIGSKIPYDLTGIYVKGKKNQVWRDHLTPMLFIYNSQDVETMQESVSGWMGRVNSTYMRQLVHQRVSWVDDAGVKCLLCKNGGPNFRSPAPTQMPGGRVALLKFPAHSESKDWESLKTSPRRQAPSSSREHALLNKMEIMWTLTYACM